MPIFLYSFMGGYQIAQYLTKIRLEIFKIQPRHYIFIQNTGDWHFNSIVYNSKQNRKLEENKTEQHLSKTETYNNILMNSRFSLAPSGSGPNSIRFWESLAVGSIPVLLSDTLELPKHPDWDNAIIVLKENELDNCLLLNERKGIVEATNASLFLIQGTLIKTPLLSEGCLKGIAREKVINIIKSSSDYDIEEAVISPFEIQKADELFITNSIIGIQPVTNYRKKVFSTDISKKLAVSFSVLELTSK